MKYKMKNKKRDIWVGLGHLCLQSTIIMIIWVFLSDNINELHILLKPLFVIITGIGGIMIYIPIGVKLEEIRKKYGTKRK